MPCLPALCGIFMQQSGGALLARSQKVSQKSTCKRLGAVDSATVKCIFFFGAPAQVRCLDLRDTLRSPGCNELAADALELLALAGRYVALGGAAPNPSPNPSPDGGLRTLPGSRRAPAGAAEKGVSGVGERKDIREGMEGPTVNPTSGPEGLLRALGALLAPGRAPLRLAAAAARALTAAAGLPGNGAAIAAWHAGAVATVLTYDLLTDMSAAGMTEQSD